MAASAALIDALVLKQAWEDGAILKTCAQVWPISNLLIRLGVVSVCVCVSLSVCVCVFVLYFPSALSFCSPPSLFERGASRVTSKDP